MGTVILRQQLRLLIAVAVCAFLLVAVLSFWAFHHAVYKDLQGTTAQSNEQVAKVLLRTLKTQYRPLLDIDNRDELENIIPQNQIRKLSALVMPLLEQTDLFKLKIYNAQGLVVYSSDPVQIGSNGVERPGFLKAMAGQISNRMDLGRVSGDSTMHDLQASYLPVYDDVEEAPVGVFELYVDLYQQLGHVREEHQHMVIFFAMALIVLLVAIAWALNYLVRVHRQELEQQQEIEKKLEYDTLHDSLSGLPNRELFMDRLTQRIDRSQRPQASNFAVLYLDLDGFKSINDRLGHNVGDVLLQQAAERLSDCIRPGDTVARLGGDEFCVLLDDLKSLDEAITVVERILSSFHAPFQIKTHEVLCSTSIGVMFCADEVTTPQQILHNADLAMYNAKSDGKGCYTLFDQNLQKQMTLRLEREGRLRNDLELGRIVPWYQPMLDLETGEMVAVEALARWQGGSSGWLEAKEFLPLAMDMGLCFELDSVMIETAMGDLNRWLKACPHCRGLRVNINLSAQGFCDPRRLEHIRSLIDSGRLPPDRVRIEVNETAVLQDLEKAEEIFDAYRQLGLQVLMDGFGMGSAPLNLIRRLHFDGIKIDKDFVGAAPQNPRDQAVLNALITMADFLGMEVTAEGIDQPEQTLLLRRIGCRVGQGLLVGWPMPADELEDWLRSGPHTPLELPAI